MWGVAMNRLLWATLGVFLLTGDAWAAASCVPPQDMKALQAAALQQQLMVAALTCHDTADYNLFVTTYRSELLESDRALKDFFLRQDAHEGEGGYNAYKTKLANVLSLRSLHDSQFCHSAKIAFDVALKRKGAQAELASERPSLIETGYASCVPAAIEKTQMADATPSLPARHPILPNSLPSAAIVVPKLAPRPDRALPPILPQRYAMTSPKRGFGFAQAGKVLVPSNTPKTTKIAEATPSLSVQRQILPDRLPSAGIVAFALPPVLPQRETLTSPKRATGQRQMSGLSKHDTYDRGANEPGDFNRYGSGERYASEVDEASPDYNPRYSDATPRPSRGYNEGEDGYGDDERDNSANFGGADNGPIGNNTLGAYRHAYNAPPTYVPYAYRPHGYWVHSYGPPVKPRLVRGPYGGWYLLPPYGR